MRKSAVVCGAGGFVASHFVKRLKAGGYWVRGVENLNSRRALQTKLYAERTAMAYGKRFNMQVRIARFQNCYGPEDPWQGGREKAPAAICRKVAQAPGGGEIEVWGDGYAVRSYTYIDDMVDGICREIHRPIGNVIAIDDERIKSHLDHDNF